MTLPPKIKNKNIFPRLAQNNRHGARNNGKGKGKGKPFKKGKTRDPNDPYWKIPDFGTALGDARVVLFTISQFSEPTNIFRVKIPVQLQRSNLPDYVVHPTRHLSPQESDKIRQLIQTYVRSTTRLSAPCIT